MPPGYVLSWRLAYPGTASFALINSPMGSAGLAKSGGAVVLKVFIAASVLGLVTNTMTINVASKEQFAASPNSGSAPLVVTFTGEGSGQLEGVMALDFGDGKIDHSISTIRGFTRTHTYVAPGTYTAELKSGPYGGQNTAVLTPLARVTITVN